MSSLYQINQDILDCIDMETGEIIDVEAFQSLQIAREDKIENIALYYKNLIADAEAYKAEKNAFAEREKRAANKAESLKRYLQTELQGKPFKTVKADISYRKSTSVYIYDEAQLPKDYLVEKITTAPDKKAIGDKLKAGEEIAGAALVFSQNVNIK
jgi:hypothetical protein